MDKFTKEWLQAASIRMLRTILQTMLSMFTIGAALSEIDWIRVISVSIVAGLYSFLTSVLTNLPEAANDGVLLVDTSDPGKDKYLMQFNTDLEKVPSKKTVIFKVDPNADLSHK